MYCVFFFCLASCCGVGVEESSTQEPVGSGAGGVAGGGGVSVIPDRPPLELDKLPPYHDVTPSPGNFPFLLSEIKNKLPVLPIGNK